MTKNALKNMLNIYNEQNKNHNGTVSSDVPKIKSVHPDVGRYEDVSDGMSASQFKWSMWIVKHEVNLYKMLVALLVILSVFFWVFSLYNWGDYLINGIKADVALERNLATFPNYAPFQAIYAAKPIIINNVNSFSEGTQAYNLVAELTNPNDDFTVSFDYHFVVGMEKTPTAHSFLLAGESRPIVSFGYKNEISGMNFVLENIVWKRVSAHKVADPLNWQKERLNFSVNNYEFKPIQSGGISAHQITFSLVNNSAYAYKQVNFVVGLMQSGVLAGVMPLNLENFRSLETRSIDLRNYSNDLYITDLTVYPVIDIYDKAVYLAPEK